jgi:hypothetical protein
MTITEQLQFSVLTAPVATLDRRTLSQAWYSALYGAGNAKNAAAKPAHESLVTGACAGAPRPSAASVSERQCRPAIEPHAAKTATRNAGAPLERRAPRSALARKIERVFLRPRSAARKASFTIEGESGRVHVLLQSHGTQLKLVAICPPKARAQVAAALAQVRYALALRGMDLQAEAREAQPC